MLKLLAEVLADFGDMREQIVPLDGFEKFERDGASQWATAKGSAMQTGMERLGDSFGGKNRSQRQSGGERLGDGGDVGQHAVVLIGEHLSGAAEAALNLVEDQRRAGFFGQCPRGFQKLAADGTNAAFALYGFNADGAHLRIELLLEIGNIVEAHEVTRQALPARTACRYLTVCVVAIEPKVRPWKEFSMASTRHLRAPFFAFRLA